MVYASDFWEFPVMLMTPETEAFFRGRLDQMIDLRKPLASLSSRLPWQEIEASIAQVFVRKVRAGKQIDDLDLFGNAVNYVADLPLTLRSTLPAAARPFLDQSLNPRMNKSGATH